MAQRLIALPLDMKQLTILLTILRTVYSVGTCIKSNSGDTVLCAGRMDVRVGGAYSVVEILLAVDWRVLVRAVYTRDGDVGIWMCKERHRPTNFQSV